MNAWSRRNISFLADDQAAFEYLDMAYLEAADDIWASYGMDAAIVFLVGA